ncbi:wax ester/triacylglycerol synthase domain-containing protein [Mycobacterium nebraskense]|uniref:wax ester/triacylglycerol synthase domain-containing protein n=1 Tax=Mycobacterium nebraskense TaxID=244292 RepID=UPI001E51D7D2|nr:wax ester/triacylglycerol synthase domain-containing protein [Mycobacterium nebraskense]
MSGIDALSLHTQGPNTPAHTLTLVTIEASDRLSHLRLHQLVAASLPQMARFRSRLVAKPLGMGQPLWAEIDDYDPSSQIHCATVRAPGGRAELADLIAELSARRLDCRERLWEAWSINGLADGQWALAVKTSPALNDGAAGAASVLPRLLTTGPRDRPDDGLPTEPYLGSAPSLGELVTDVLHEIVENHATSMWLIADTASRMLQGSTSRLLRSRVPGPTAQAAPSISGPVPHTVFNAALTKRRAVAFASIPLADARTVSDAFGGSTTNVVLAACAMSLRAWLQKHDTVPDCPLLMRMPFELPPTDHPRTGKAMTVGRLRIPVHLDDPVQMLANLHTATERLAAIRRRSYENRSSTTDSEIVASLIPPVIAQLGMQLYSRSGMRHQLKPICHGNVSCIAVEPKLAYCAGSKVVRVYTVGPLSEESGLNIALTTRGEELDVSVCACPDNVPAVDDIATGVVRSVATLVAAAHQSPRGHGRSVVTEMVTHPATRSRGSAWGT